MNNLAPELSQQFRMHSEDLLDQSMIKIRNCFRQLNEVQIWWRENDSQNSIGNLVLHICGNLNQWTGALANRKDDRKRDLEFSTTGGMSKQQLLEIATSATFDAVQIIASLNDDDLVRDFDIQGFNVSGMKAVLHTTTHFVAHTHQIILLTRLQLDEAYEFAWQPDYGENDLPI